MGNSESTSGDTYQDSQYERAEYARNAVDANYGQENPAHVESPVDTTYRYQSPAGSSMDTNNQRKDRPTYIADNFNSLDEDSQYERAEYARNAVDANYGQENPAYVESPVDTTHRYQSPAGSSMDTNNQRKDRPTYIADNFNSLDEVITALREEGLESSNLILGIDFTKSNEWTGKHSFRRRSLHSIGDTPNPYQQAISIIGRTLSPFDEDNLIPCFGFGDATTHDHRVFSFYSDHRPCHGFEEALARYKEIVPYLKLSGPTSFAPIIDCAIDIVERSNGQYHVLVIIADGQVSTNSDTGHGKLSRQEQETIDSIVAASEYPLSIILVGVGDGPWDEMQQFDDNIRHRAFDNFQFVNFTKIMSENNDMAKRETSFALAALMEIPFQYRAALRLPHKEKLDVTGRKSLPPPQGVVDHDNAAKSFSHGTNFESTDPGLPADQVCPICLTNPKDMTFGCGHLTCKDCGVSISSCPLCRQPITTRIKLYG